MVVAGSLAALVVRRMRAGPMLLAGLFLLAAADALGDARTVVLIGVDRSLHGAGAGVALTGVIAVITEHRAHQPGGGTGGFPPRWVGSRPAGGTRSWWRGWAWRPR